MENRQKQMLKEKMETIESFYGKAESEDEWGELQWTMHHYKIRKGLGILEANKRRNALTLIVGLCKDWIAQNGEEAEWLVGKGWLGLPLTRAEKVELAKYHCSLTYIYISNQ